VGFAPARLFCVFLQIVVLGDLQAWKKTDENEDFSDIFLLLCNKI